MARPARSESDISGENLQQFLMLFVLGTASYHLQFILYLGLQQGHFSHFLWLAFFLSCVLQTKLPPGAMVLEHHHRKTLYYSTAPT